MLENIGRGIEILRRTKKLLLVSHYDADGLSSAAIMKKILERLNIEFKIMIIKEIDKNSINKIKNENLPVVFTDIGSSSLVETIPHPVIILDHHEPLRTKKDNIVEINPEINGIRDYSGSCVTYLFGKSVDGKNVELSPIALVGLAGDYGIPPNGIEGRPKEILQDAVNNGLIRVKKGIRLFGHSSRALHKALEYSFDPYIPNVSGSESAAVQFLSELGIKPKGKNGFIRFSDLRDDEKEKLASAIILERIAHGVENPTDIFGVNYYLNSGYELREFATIVNAFGRLERFKEGIEFCLNPSREKGNQVLDEYRKNLGRYLKWAFDNIQSDGFISVINAKDKIHPNFISPVVSIFFNIVKDNVVLGSAYDGESVKVSVRNKTEVEVHKIVGEIASKLGGVGGGHPEACGARIPKENEEKFLSLLRQSLKNVINKKV